PAVAFVDLQTLTLSVDALNVPEQVEISVEDTEDGYQLFAGDVTLPEDSELVTDAEILVVSVAVPRIEEEPEEGEGEAAEGESAEEPAEEEGPSGAAGRGVEAPPPRSVAHTPVPGRRALRGAPVPYPGSCDRPRAACAPHEARRSGPARAQARTRPRRPAAPRRRQASEEQPHDRERTSPRPLPGGGARQSRSPIRRHSAQHRPDGAGPHRRRRRRALRRGAARPGRGA